MSQSLAKFSCRHRGGGHYMEKLPENALETCLPLLQASSLSLSTCLPIQLSQAAKFVTVPRENT